VGSSIWLKHEKTRQNRADAFFVEVFVELFVELFVEV
jgi:hypothetical protein